MLHSKLIRINRDNGNTSAVLFHMKFTHILHYRYDLRPYPNVELKWVNTGSVAQFVYNISGLFSARGQCVFVCLRVCVYVWEMGWGLYMPESIYLSAATPDTQGSTTKTFIP